MGRSVSLWFLLFLACSSLVNCQRSRARKRNSNFYWKRPGYVMPWLKGPNVCAVEEVTGSRKRYYSECMAYMPRTICEKPTFIRYHCCTGFERAEDDDSDGCNAVTPIDNLMETAKNLYLREFRSHAKNAGLSRMLRNEGAFTVFAPHNQAFKSMTQAQREILADPIAGEDLMRYHIARDRYNLRDLTNEMKIPSVAEGTPDLLINRYSNGIVTVNCARVVMPDQVATNGILHTVEKVIKPMPDTRTIMEILLHDEVHNFGELATALIVTQLGNLLRDETKMFTLFAPTDAAFRNGPPDVVEKILNDKDALERLLNYHIMEGHLCSAAVLGPMSVKTLEGQTVNITCDINDSIRVNDVRVTTPDIIAANGVIHVLDDILVPDKVKTLEDVLVELDMLEFLEYAQQAGAADILRGRAEGNYTIFAPNADAFKNLSPAEKRLLQTNPSAVRRVFQYHISPAAISTRTVVSNHAAPTNNGIDSMQITVQHNGFSVNGAKIVSSDHEADNGVVHVVDRILWPPEDSAVDKVKEDSRLSTFLSTLQTISLDGLLLNLEGNFTVFAPSNDAFDAMQNSYLESLMLNPDKLRQFLEYHILKNPVYTNVMQPTWDYNFKTLTGDRLRVTKSAESEEGEGSASEIRVNGHALILDGPTPSTNGVVYIIDEVLRCPCLD